MLLDGDAVGLCRRVRALPYPPRVVLYFAGEDPSLALRKVRAEKSATFGFDAETGEYADLKKRGILDPVKVTRHALQNAASVAALLLTTEAMISDIPEEDEKPAAGAGAPPMM